MRCAGQLNHAVNQPVAHAAHVLAISHVVREQLLFPHDPYDLQRPLDDHEHDIANAEVGSGKTDVRDQIARIQRMTNDPLRSGRDDAAIGQQKDRTNAGVERNSGNAEN